MPEKSDKAGGSVILARLAADWIAGSVAGVAVTPLVSSVDRALAENASGKMKLWPSFFASFKEMGRAPIKFVKSPQFFWIWLTYSSTYWAANWCMTVCDKYDTDPGLPKWIATSLTNTYTCILKDRAFARIFGTKSVGSVPMGSYGAWLMRDFVSMAVIFSAPPVVGKQVAKYTGSEESGYYAAQIVLPLALQTVTTPIHLLGYDIYNNPKADVSARIAFLKKDYFKNVAIRMLRMAAPWSFGTIGNTKIRKELTAAFTGAGH